MKYRPDDAELLDAMASLLEDEVMPAVGPDVRHKVRVAANLARILQRQQAMETDALERERRGLARLLGIEGDVPSLRAELDHRLREGDPTVDEDQAWELMAWESLVSVARDDLAAAKPGYDAWEAD